MTGLAVAHGHGSADGALGIAPKAKVIPVRVSDEAPDKPASRTTPATPEAFAAGIDWLVTKKARIISISQAMSGWGQYDIVKAAIKNARSTGVIVIISAGNKPRDHWAASAGLDVSILAGASNKAAKRDPVTAEPGPFDPITLLAPGRDVVTTSRRHGYRRGTGTSPSSPIIAGTAALIWSKWPNLSADEVVWRMLATARDVGPKGYDKRSGWGIVDPVAALSAKVAPSPGPTSTPTAAVTCSYPELLPPACLPPRASKKPTPAVAAELVSTSTVIVLALFGAVVVLGGVAVAVVLAVVVRGRR
jgi:subtilisin family serine protease